MAKGAIALPGFRDFYPEEFAARAFIQETWRGVARRFGFVEYDGPPLESLDLYTRKSGDEIVGQLYNFRDKGDREIALRPEMTPTRWFSIPQLFRYERQQKGRLREHFQLNVDIVGEPDVTADAELLAVALECMRAFSLTSADVRARVSDRRLLVAILQSLAIPDAATPAVFAVIDKLDRQPRDVSTDKLIEAGVSREASGRLLELQALDSVDAIRQAFRDPAVTARVDDLARYLDYLEALGVRDWVDIDLTIVRGLAYYTGIVFELFDAKGDFRAICGGGRYDTLLASLSAIDLPALGFGMGDVVLGELLKVRGLLPAAPPALDVWVAYEDPGQLVDAMKTATALRRQGSSVEYALKAAPLGRQLDAARKASARTAVILRADGSRVRKDLASGTEEPFTFPNG
jgi:histidyl-tRNA synthetase